MAKLTLATIAALAASASAFAPAPSQKASVAVRATGFEEVGGKPWDPLSLGKLEDAADTFPNMFPKSQFLQEAEIKHGRMSMLAWTGCWATTSGGMGLGMHIPGFPWDACPAQSAPCTCGRASRDGARALQLLV